MNLLKNELNKLYQDKGLDSILGVEDWVDQMNFGYSVLLLLIGSVIVASGNYFFKAIACYLPTEVDGSNFIKYVENFCWVEGTGAFHHNESLPQTRQGWEASMDTRRLGTLSSPFNATK
ncbi:unnamed protein product [Protopolystoma xenopodis]|uniref:Innexin n=1 Tax=Protopolystoma xenopodis TaxID=117903 RepID=A0A3S5B1F9_9PLAT|nr:unnamed protein product [Protopolystoma xenopodis]